MKLFIWANPFKVFYGSSMLIAVAETLEQAKEEAKTAPAYIYAQYNESGPGPITLKDPDRIVELPCAEWHTWKE